MRFYLSCCSKNPYQKLFLARLSWFCPFCQIGCWRNYLGCSSIDPSHHLSCWHQKLHCQWCQLMHQSWLYFHLKIKISIWKGNTNMNIYTYICCWSEILPIALSRESIRYGKNFKMLISREFFFNVSFISPIPSNLSSTLSIVPFNEPFKEMW